MDVLLEFLFYTGITFGITYFLLIFLTIPFYCYYIGNLSFEKTNKELFNFCHATSFISILSLTAFNLIVAYL